MPEKPQEEEGRPTRPPINPKSLDSNRRRYQETWDAVANALSGVEAMPEHMVSALRWMANEIESDGLIWLWNGDDVPTPEPTKRTMQREASLNLEKQRARVIAHVAHVWRVSLRGKMIDARHRDDAVQSLLADGFGEGETKVYPSPIGSLVELAAEAVSWAEEQDWKYLFSDGYGRKTLEKTLRAINHQDGKPIYTGNLDETMDRVVSWATNEAPLKTAWTARRVTIEQTSEDR